MSYTGMNVIVPNHQYNPNEGLHKNNKQDTNRFLIPHFFLNSISGIALLSKSQKTVKITWCEMFKANRTAGQMHSENRQIWRINRAIFWKSEFSVRNCNCLNEKGTVLFPTKPYFHLEKCVIETIQYAVAMNSVRLSSGWTFSLLATLVSSWQNRSFIQIRCSCPKRCFDVYDLLFRLWQFHTHNRQHSFGWHWLGLLFNSRNYLYNWFCLKAASIELNIQCKEMSSPDFEKSNQPQFCYQQSFCELSTLFGRNGSRLDEAAILNFAKESLKVRIRFKLSKSYLITIRWIWFR